MRGKDRRGMAGKELRPSIEEYMMMSEEEKDIAIQRAVIRLRTRIQEILFQLDSNGRVGSANHRGKEVKKDDQGP